MSFEQEWNQPLTPTTSSEKIYKQVPDGTYKATLVQTDVQLSQDEKHKAKLRFKVQTADDNNGLLVFSQFNLFGAGMQIFKRELVKMGVDLSGVNSFQTLESVLAGLVNREFEIFVKERSYTKQDGSTGKAQNVYTNKALSAGAVANVNHAQVPPKTDFDQPLPF